MITGFHTILYSDDAEATRAFFRDVLEWPSLDAGGGWLIFKTPPSEMGIHPSTGPAGEQWATIPHHQASFMCDDLDATIADLRNMGVVVADEIEEEDYGRVTSMLVPSAGWLMIYQPHHGLAHQL
jgi:catechol 2,3-dioxygenase-like lactoylglutathione lyase family enzyme